MMWLRSDQLISRRVVASKCPGADQGFTTREQVHVAGEFSALYAYLGCAIQDSAYYAFTRAVSPYDSPTTALRLVFHRGRGYLLTPRVAVQDAALSVRQYDPGFF